MEATLADYILNDKIPFEEIIKYQERIKFLKGLIEDTRKEVDDLISKRRQLTNRRSTLTLLNELPDHKIENALQLSNEKYFS